MNRNLSKFISLIFVFMTMCFLNEIHAQNRKNISRKTEIFQLFDHLEESFLLFPPDIKRIAILEVRTNLQGISVSNHEIQSILTQKTSDIGLKVVLLPELDATNVLTFNANDSNLKIENKSPLTRIKENPEKLKKLCLDNSIQALMKFQIHYDSILGPRMYITAIGPRNMEILWQKSIQLKNNFILNQSLFEANLGIGIMGISKVTNSLNNTNNPITADLNAVYYNFGLNYNTALNVKKNVFLGFHGTLKVVNQTPVRYKDTNLGSQPFAYLPSAGINCTIHFLKKHNYKPEYWSNFRIGLNYFNYNSHTLSLEQQLNFEISNHLRVGVRYEQAFDEFTTFNQKNKTFTFLDKTNYGLQATFSF
jgi:hypothetical protein